MFEYNYSNYKNFGKCITISNGKIELTATVDVGPRIIGFKKVGGENVIFDNSSVFSPNTNEEFEKFYGKGKAFNIYGGHRLWLSPEYYPETYYPDNDKVNVEILQNGIILTPAPQIENGVQLEIKITLGEDSYDAEILHSVKNIGTTNKKCALWGVTACAFGGTEIIPLNTHDTGFLPNGKIAYWPYTDLRSDNIYLGKKYAVIRQPKSDALKLGFDLKCGKVYYALENDVFIKSYTSNCENAVYPDGGVSFETYACEYYTELETLGELKVLAPGETSYHTEKWSLCSKKGDFDIKNENSIDEFLANI